MKVVGFPTKNAYFYAEIQAFNLYNQSSAIQIHGS